MKDMSVTFYTTHCPKCRVIETKLKRKGVSYNIVDDTKVMMDMGIRSAPQLMVDGNLMDFKQANDWINSLPQEEDKTIL